MWYISILLACLAIFASAFQPARADNCASVAKQLAASRGAQVLSSTPVTSGGQTICEVKLLIPGKGGKPPRVETVQANG
jgi:hypothetical protein